MDIFDSLINENEELIDNIRNNLILDKKRVYFDYTATALGYLEIEKRIGNIMKDYSNTHSGESSTISILYKKAIETIKSDLKLGDSHSIIMSGYGATGAIEKAMDILGLRVSNSFAKRVKHIEVERPLVIGGPYEHHSNILEFKNNPFCDYERIGRNGDDFDFVRFEEVLKKNLDREIIVSISACSNVTGALVDIEKIYKISKRYNALVLVDTASIAPYKNISCEFYDMAFVSPHKFLGAVSTPGLLVIKNELIGETPSFAGGGTVKYVSRSKAIYKDEILERESAGTQDVMGVIKMALAIRLKNNIGEDFIHRIKKSRSERLYYALSKIENIVLYTKKRDLSQGIISFNIRGKNHYDVAKELLDKYNVEVRAGCSCAGPYVHDLLEIDDLENPTAEEIRELGWIRVSVHYAHNINDIDYLIEKIEKISESA